MPEGNRNTPSCGMQVDGSIPAPFKRSSDYMTHSVFHDNHSEHEMLRCAPVSSLSLCPTLPLALWNPDWVHNLLPPQALSSLFVLLTSFAGQIAAGCKLR